MYSKEIQLNKYDRLSVYVQYEDSIKQVWQAPCLHTIRTFNQARMTGSMSMYSKEIQLNKYDRLNVYTRTYVCAYI